VFVTSRAKSEERNSSITNLKFNYHANASRRNFRVRVAVVVVDWWW